MGGSIAPNLQPQINIAQTNFNAARSNFTGVNGVQAQAIAAWKQYQVIDPGIDFPTFVQSQFPLYLQAKQELV